jgi:hypothetical protein
MILQPHGFFVDYALSRTDAAESLLLWVLMSPLTSPLEDSGDNKDIGVTMLTMENCKHQIRS